MDDLPDRVAMAATANLQSQSDFFRIPAELRQRIVSHLCDRGTHVFIDEHGRLASAPCVQTPDDFANDREETLQENMFFLRYRCSYAGEGEREAKWIRRLGTAWSCHWRCEESMLEVKARSPLGSLMLLCRRAYLESIDFIYESTTFVITDLATVGQVLLPNPTTMPLAVAFIRSLSIALQPRLALWRTVTAELGFEQCRPPDPENIEPSARIDLSATWIAFLSEALPRMQHLRSLHIWLDIGNRRPWAMVNERAILSSLLDIMPSLQARQVGVTISLPNILEDSMRESYHLANKETEAATLVRHPRLSFYYRERFLRWGDTDLTTWYRIVMI